MDPLTRELFELRRGDRVFEAGRVLGEGLAAQPRVAAALALAADFRTWQSLTRTGLSRADAVETMVASILAQ